VKVGTPRSSHKGATLNGILNGGNGAVKVRSVLIMYLSLAMSIVALGKTVFFSGSELGGIDAHLSYNDQRMDELTRRLDNDENRDQPSIEAMRAAVQQEEHAVEQENELISDLKAQLKRGR
jgi:hypothetical protein